jgi:hexosaminidase
MGACILAALLFMSHGCFADALIPLPTHIEHREGHCQIKQGFSIVFDGENRELRDLGGYCAQQLKAATGLEMPVRVRSAKEKGDGALMMTLVSTPQSLGKEGYTLESGPRGITIQACAPAGLFYGIQTLLQLLPPAAGGAGPVTVPSVSIRDMPRYPYRGMHLDVCRHFFTKEFIKKYLDLLAMYKFNSFHWHLTEDQGWRIEIRKYPRLADYASRRKETVVGYPGGNTPHFDGTPYGGFYSQSDIREIVEYARKRYITVIPEIEMPGHSLAALAAYPELSCTGGPFEVATKWGIFKDVYCAGNDRVFEFIQDTLTEVIDLFPGTYIHIGGDECPKDRWQHCTKCQARMKSEGIKDEHGLQSYFIRRIEQFLLSKGRRLIGWDEILEGGLAPEATVMSWRGTSGGIKAAKQHHDVIMTPTRFCYFDYYQADRASEPQANGGYIPLEKVYSFEPTPPELTPDEAAHILGAQGNVWTECIPTPAHAEYMSVPRMCALAEVVWSPASSRDWENFKRRLESHFGRLDAMKVNYCRKTVDAKMEPPAGK